MDKQEFSRNPGTHFVEMPCFDTDSQTNLRNGVIIISPLTVEKAVDKFLKTKKHIAHYELATTYTAGCEGQEEHIWDFSHYEIYNPADKRLPSLVVLRYRRRHFKKILEPTILTELAM